MEVVCSQCQGKFKIPDEKLPVEQVVFIPCPRCKFKLTLDTRTRKLAVDSGFRSDVKATSPLGFQNNNVLQAGDKDAGDYDGGEIFLESLDSEAKTALICESEIAVIPRIQSSLKYLGYHVTVSTAIADALKKMRFQAYDMIILNEFFGCTDPNDNPVLTYLNGLNMSTRRHIFVVLMSKRSHVRTMDKMAALNSSVNVVIHVKDLNEMVKVVRRAIEDHQAFYSIFMESLEKIGRG